MTPEQIAALEALPSAEQLKSLKLLTPADAKAFFRATDPRETAKVEAWVGAMAPVLKEWMAHSLAPLLARIAELEARPVVRFCGVWRTGTPYAKGSLAIRDGALWHANTENTQATPGKSDDWTLASKSGSVR
jgi:hypothetical protein